MSQLPKPQVDQLRAFINLLSTTPGILHDPALSFFRDYLLSMGAKIPPAPEKQEPKPNKSPEPEKINPNKAEEMEQDEEPLDGEPPEEDPESDIELDMSGVIGNSNILSYN